LGKHEQEFLKIEFADKDILYVPTYEAEILTKYSNFQAIEPKLDKIGGKTWKIKKNRAKKSILLFVRELLYLYAKRKSIKGFSYTGDKDLEEKLSESFPYIETPDQTKAIKEVLNDLSKEYPMERLVCGDVSFGKTEVAIRAAFRVVSEGKQVAVLCPTTILADQHFKTFK
jgi:transcription-repair coupling factor (superfamily II helicase)